MRLEDEKILNELVPDGQARIASRQKKRAASEDPADFTGDPEADAYGWLNAKRNSTEETVTVKNVMRPWKGGESGVLMEGSPEGSSKGENMNPKDERI